jgi:hypothetical protein
MIRGAAVCALLFIALAGCNQTPNGTGGHAPDDRGEIARTGTFQGQETHGEVGTLQDQASGNTTTSGSAANGAE